MATEDLTGFFNNERSEEEEDDIRPPTPLPFTQPEEARCTHHHHQQCSLPGLHGHCHPGPTQHGGEAGEEDVPAGDEGRGQIFINTTYNYSYYY